MPMTDVTSGLRILATHIQQIVASWNGYSGKGVPLKQITVNDDGEYAGRFRNLGAGGAFAAESSDGDLMIAATDDGARLSPDGTNLNQVPAVLGLVQEFTARPTFSTPIDHQYVAGVASTASLTLPSTGNVFQITGTTPITSIAAIDGARVVLLFQSALCKVADNGTTLNLHGDFWSLAGATLELVCDGTNWYEVGRAGQFIPQCSLYLSGDVAIARDDDYQVAWSAEGSDLLGFHAANAADIIPTVPGVYLVLAGATLEYDNRGSRTLRFDLNATGVNAGSTVGAATKANNETDGLTVADFLTFNGTTDALNVVVGNFNSNAATVDLKAGAGNTYVYLRWLGPS